MQKTVESKLEWNEKSSESRRADWLEDQCEEIELITI